MLELYHAPLSPCAQKVRLVLHEKQLPYNGVLIDLARKENLKPDYLALNPNGVVPTLVDDGQPIIESSIICEYLDDRFSEHPLRPINSMALAKMRLWAKRVDEKIHYASGVLIFGAIMRRAFLHLNAAELEAMLEQIPDAARRERQADLIKNGLDSPRVPSAAQVLKDMADDIETAVLRTAWVLGDDLTLTDFALVPYARQLEVLGLDKVFKARPAMADWMDRIKQTAGYRGGMAAFESLEQANHRATYMPVVTARLEPLF